MEFTSLFSDLAVIFIDYLSVYWSSLYLEAMMVLSLSTAFLGLFKTIPGLSKLKGTTIYDVIFAWLSMLLTVCFTFIHAWISGTVLQDVWIHCIVNCMTVIAGYWLIKSVAIKNMLYKVFCIIKNKVTQKKPKNLHQAKTALKDIQDEIESLITNPKSTAESKYSDDDLKNL